MIVLGFEIDAKSAEEGLARVEQQIPFATSRALNDVASSSRLRVQRELPRDFIIRRPWIAKGIIWQAATKRDLTAYVGSRDSFMALQATGGVKRGRRHDLALPVKIRGSVLELVPRGKWPGRLLKATAGKRKAFIATMPRTGTTGVFRRKGKARLPITKLYEFRESITQRRRFHLIEAVTDTVVAEFDAAIARRLGEAVATAR